MIGRYLFCQDHTKRKSTPCGCFFVLLAFGKAGVGFEACDLWSHEPSTRWRFLTMNALHFKIMIANKRLFYRVRRGPFRHCVAEYCVAFRVTPEKQQITRTRRSWLTDAALLTNPISATKKDSIVDTISAMEFCFLALKPLILMAFRAFFLL